MIALCRKVMPLMDRISGHLTNEEILEENILVEESRSDPKKFGKLYDRYFEAIFNFIFRRTDEEETAADLTSQTFIKALENIKKYEFRGVPFSAWLFRIATNEINKYYRKKNKKKIFSIEEDLVKGLISEDTTDPIEDKLPMILQVLNEVPTQLVEILELRFFEGRSFKEISYILEISESGAKMRTYRALEKIRQIVKLNKGDNEQS